MERKSPYSVIQQQIFPRQGYAWHPGIFRRAPWTALFALTVALLCATASAVIIVISDQKPATWFIQPSVVLAFLASSTTALLIVPLTSGTAITWWRAALSPEGTTLARLHHIWSHGGGGGVLSALFSGRDVNKVALASVVLALTSIAYSPLLQRASHTGIRPVGTNVTISMDIFEKLPDYVAGYVYNGEYGDITLGLPMLQAVQGWFNYEQLQTWPNETYTCNGTCYGHVTAPGVWGTGFTQTKVPIDVKQAARNGDMVFGINFTRFDTSDGVPILQMMAFGIDKVDENCIGELVTNTIDLYAVTMQYPIWLQGSNITLDPNISHLVITEGPLKTPGDLQTAALYSPAGPLAAMKWFGDVYFTSNATLTENDYGSFIINPVGIAAHQFVDSNPADYPVNSTCAIQYADPTDAVILAMERVLFRASLYAGFATRIPGQTIVPVATETQHVEMVRTKPTLVYQSVHLYLIIGSALLIFAVVGVSSTIYGWWELGRDVSLSPLEVVKAFEGAKMLYHPETPVEATQLIERIGERRVRYGVVSVRDVDGAEKHELRMQEVGVGIDPVDPRRASLAAESLYSGSGWEGEREGG